MKRVLAFSFFLFLLEVVHGTNEQKPLYQKDGLEYFLLEGGGVGVRAICTKGNPGIFWGKSREEIHIPSMIHVEGKTYTVTDIMAQAFSAHYSSGRTYSGKGNPLKTITIPKTIVRIHEEAFRETWIKNIDLPNSVTSIGARAFQDCDYLTTVAIPSSVTSIEESTFEGCNRLISVTIPKSVTIIARRAFYGCTSLSSIYIPSSVEEIGQAAFCGCSSLMDICIPSSVHKIGAAAFSSCRSLIKVKGLYATIDKDELVFYETPYAKSNYKKSFDYFSNSLIIPAIKEWQKKRDFETTAQWRERVTKANQDRKIQELTAQAIKEYTEKNPMKATLGGYDADYQLYKIESNYGEKYVKVPQSEAPAFKTNFDDATFLATFTPTNEGNLVINDLLISVKGKRYMAEQTAVEVASNTLDFELPEMDLSGASQGALSAKTAPTMTVDNSLDQNIPTNAATNKNTFAVIIGNEKYTRVAQVPFAQNDAKIFAEYCWKTLGLPETNVKVYENATYGAMIGAVSDIQKVAKAYKGDINVIFYYAGHGIPDDATGEAYLLPIDADGMKTEVCYPLNRLYKELGELHAHSVTAFMDACFSGAQRGNGMVVAARGVAIKAKSERPTGNTVVFTAATDKQTAFPYREKGHGMFTYYLLKKLHDTKGDCTLGELSGYICDEVAKQAVVTNGKEQTPMVLTSEGVMNSWRSLKLK